MIAVNYSTIRENLRAYCDKVTEDFETIIVTRKDEKNVVMISLEEYNNLMENLFIMSNPKNYNYLLESKAEIDAGKVVKKEWKELEDLANG
jgi:antitoxin YefM